MLFVRFTFVGRIVGKGCLVGFAEYLLLRVCLVLGWV